MKILEAKFTAAAPTAQALPPGTLPEVAFVGRSNVGKSSLIATLVERKKLVRISQRPGCTQSINFFEIRTEAGPLMLVDLPGYGYAAAPVEEQRRWGPLVSAYLRDRPTLCLVVVLLDPRRPVREDDEMLFDMLADCRTPHVVVATKVDKIPKSQRKLSITQMAQATDSKVLGTSAKDGAGAEQLWQLIGRACGLRV